MTYKLILAASLSLGLGTAMAMAQADTNQPSAGAASDTTAATQMPMGWDGPIEDAFFSDSELGTLRSQDEISANWEGLSEEQQAQVRSHCDTIDTTAAGSTTGEAATTGDATAGADADSDMTTSSTTQGSAMHTASIDQVCDWVDAM